MRLPLAASLLALVSANLAAQEPAPSAVAKPAAITADGIPPVPAELAERTRPYFEYRTASFTAWNPETRAMLISTRFGNTPQLHRVERPGGARTQITFEAEPVRGGGYTEGADPVLLTQKDVGGGEFFQIFSVADGRLTMLTDGKSRNSIGAGSEDGKLVAFSSTKRNGADTDIYLMDPRNPASTRMLLERKGGGWGAADFSPDGKTMLLQNYVSVNESHLYVVDVATGKERQLIGPKNRQAIGGVQYDAQGRIWMTSDVGADFARLGTLDPKSGKFTPVISAPWDIDGFDIAPDGSFIVYQVNEAGLSGLYVRDMASGQSRRVNLPPGVLGGIEIAPWGEIGFTFVSNQASGDAYSVDPRTLAVTRWTTSETGGLDPMKNVLPELVEITSFDGEKMSGFLYRPDPAKFPGKRPLVFDIHGGPEGQSMAVFLGRGNYLVNELGVALFFPNVRGSTGYGKRFVALDNGPFKREDSVKDLGAFLDRLEADPGIDATRMAVSGGSYGGYMCYAAAIRYGTRFDAASCVVAISDFVTFLENTQSYRRDLRRVEYGDERDAKQRAKLKEISPLTRASEIRIPLMVSTGANDPRVPASEADQIIAAVRANGQEAWHFLAGNEGHGFAKKENADYNTWAEIMFWEKYLLGK